MVAIQAAVRSNLMNDPTSIVYDLWRSHEKYLGDKSVELHRPDIVTYLSSVFCPGPHFYYVIDSPTLTFDYVSNSTQDIFGIPPEDMSIPLFVDRLHPDDVEIFVRGEDVVAHFFRNCIDPSKITKYKICYCFRLRTKEHGYRLFLMQTLTMKTTSEGSLLKVFGVQTDITHITSTNNGKLSFIGMEGEPSVLELDIFDDKLFDNYTPYAFATASMPFSKRELVIIRLLGYGLSTTQIAHKLNISEQTVHTHRKNILRKSGLNNTAALVADCLKKGFI